MQILKSAGKIFYGLGIAGLGLQHFLYPGFRPVILPVPAEATQHHNIWVHLTGIVLIAAGLSICFLRKVNKIALFLGVFLLLFFLIGHLPNRIANHPEIIGVWTDALKLLALSGGAFIVATAYYDGKEKGIAGKLANLAAYGKYFFALLLVIFGIDHFVYTEFVKTLVPAWIPGPLFWTYVGGVALFGSGLAIFINFKPKVICLLLGIMLFIWLNILHIPRTISAPATDNGNELTSVFECLAFSGMAFLLSLDTRNKK